MRKAIIFEFFDVLALQGSDSFRLTYFPDDVVKNNQVKELQSDRERGIVDFNRFVSKVAAVGGVRRQIVLKHIENYQPNVQVLNYIQDKLKPKYKIGMISVTDKNWLLRILGSKNLAMFDDIVLSNEAITPELETKMFKLAAKNLGVKTKNCIYIGYLPSSCQAAEAAGMKSIWYWGFMQIEKEFG